VRNRFLSSRSSRGFLNIPLCSGSLFSGCHKFFEAKVCAESSCARYEAAYLLAATLSGARRFFRAG
jgi:hypothetical protein